MRSDKFIINDIELDNLIVKINQEVDFLSRYEDNSGKIVVLVVEKFYFRIESNLAATIIFDRINESQYQIVIAVAGGRHGLLGISWGAEKSMLKKIKKIFLEYM